MEKNDLGGTFMKLTFTEEQIKNELNKFYLE